MMKEKFERLLALRQRIKNATTLSEMEEATREFLALADEMARAEGVENMTADMVETLKTLPRH